jgi:hypothetical protein
LKSNISDYYDKKKSVKNWLSYFNI